MKNNNTDYLEQQVEQTKSNIVHSLELVEAKVRDKVDDVKQSLDFKSKVIEHPLAAVGGSVLTGLLVGALISGSDSSAGDSASGSSEETRVTPSRTGGLSSWVKKLAHEFDDEIRMAKGMAVGAVLGNVMKRVEEKTPQFSPYLRPIVDSVKGKTGYSVPTERTEV